MGVWQRYWFAPGGRVGVAIVRVAIAVSVAWTLTRVLSGGYAAEPARAPYELYRAVGLWMLWGSAPPPVWLLEALPVVAYGATLGMALGLCTRVSTMVSWLSAVALVSFDVSFTATWSHHNNLPLIAQLTFVFARSGDALSLDALYRRLRKLAPREVPGGYQWSLRLVQLAVALMFFGAAMAKLYFSGGTLAWAMSDNLRHQLLARFDWIGVPRTAAAEWLLQESWRYRVAALGNLCMQIGPVLSVFLVRRPILRALAGSVFVVEVLALGVVMDLWNVHWLPLAAVFVDWDRLLGPGAAAPSGEASERLVLPARATAKSAFIALFLLYDAVVLAGLDQRLRTYPFSAYPMFGYVRAKKPYHVHQSYEMPGTSIELLSEPAATAHVQERIDAHHTFRLAYRVRDASALEHQLTAMQSLFQESFPELKVFGVRLHLASFQAPAYPAPAGLTRHRLAILGELRQGVVTSALGQVQVRGGSLIIRPNWRGEPVPGPVTYQAIVDYRIEPVALAVSAGADGALLAPRPEGGSVVILALAGGRSYVVGEVGRRRW